MGTPQAFQYNHAKSKFARHFKPLWKPYWTLGDAFENLIRVMIRRYSFTELQKQTGISHHTFSKWSRERGLKSRGHSSDSSHFANVRKGIAQRKIDRRKVVSLYENGLTLKEIAELLSVNNSTLCRMFAKEKLKRFRDCKRCDKRFQVSAYRVIYCSKQCSYLRKRQFLHANKLCARNGCNKIWEVIDRNSSSRKYCNPECKRISTNASRLASYHRKRRVTVDGLE